MEQLKSGEGTTPSGSVVDGGAGDTSNVDASNAEFNRWVDEEDEQELRSHKHMKGGGGVQSTAQQLLTSITQPVSMVIANGQQVNNTEHTIG